MRAGGDPGCRQRGVPALENLVGADHRPGSPQRRRPGILYADQITDSLEYALGETERRRAKQSAYNRNTASRRPASRRSISNIVESVYETDYVTVDTGVGGETQLVGHNIQAVITDLNKKMQSAAANLEFEEAARMRDEIRRLEAHELGLDKPGVSQKARAAWEPEGKKKRRKGR